MREDYELKIYKRRTEVVFHGGVSIDDAVASALRLSLDRGEPVDFAFNGRSIMVDAWKLVGDIISEQFNT